MGFSAGEATGEAGETKGAGRKTAGAAGAGDMAGDTGEATGPGETGEPLGGERDGRPDRSLAKSFCQFDKVLKCFLTKSFKIKETFEMLHPFCAWSCSCRTLALEQKPHKTHL